jgi:outer membrane protein TolC
MATLVKTTLIETARHLLAAALITSAAATTLLAQVGSVGISQSTVNAGGANAVNLINSSVNIQGAYQGSVPAGTATNTAVSLTLEGALQRALKYNFGIVTATENAHAASAERIAALSELLPSVNVGAQQTLEQSSLSALGLRPATFPGHLPVPSVIGPYNYFDLHGSVTQTVLDLSKLHNLRSVKETALASEFDIRDSRDLVILAATGGYLQVLMADARVRTAEASVRTSEAIYRLATDQLNNGLAARIDVTRSEVQLQTDQQRLRGLRAEFEKQKLTLAQVIGLPAGQEFTIADNFEFRPLTGINQDQALLRATETRADIAAARAAVRAGEQALKAARSEYLPSVSVSAEYGVVGINPAQSNGTFGLSAGVNIPIWQGRRVEADVDRARSALSQRKSAEVELESRVGYQVRQTFIDLSAAEDQVGVAAKNVELARETLRQAQDRFTSEVADTIEVVQAQQTVEQAENDLISTIHEHNLAKAALARTIGDAENNIPQFLKGN